MLQTSPRSQARPTREGTVTPERHTERERLAYNAAFCELELNWHWDCDTYARLLAIEEEKRRIEAYIERHQPHLLRAYDAAFLSNLIFETKQRLREQMSRAS